MFAGIALLLALCAQPRGGWSQEVVDQSQPLTNLTSMDCGNPPGMGSGSIGQTFVPSMGTVSAVSLYLRHGGSMPAGGVTSTVNLRAGGPSGPILAQASTLLNGHPSIASQGMHWYKFDFPVPVCVTPGDTCYIEWISTGGKIASWLASPGNPYPAGELFGCFGTLAPGSEFSDWDFAFMTWSKPVVDLLPPTLVVTTRPAILDPPNGRLVPVRVSLVAADDGCGAPDVRLVSATRSGHGRRHEHDERADIVGADIGTRDTLVHLRAADEDARDTLTYTLTYEAVDATGKRTQSSAVVLAPPRRWRHEGRHGDEFALGVESAPASGGRVSQVRITLSADVPATLECLDVSGRVVSSCQLGALAAGTHVVSLPWSRRPAPGAYWVRVRQGTASSATRMVFSY